MSAHSIVDWLLTEAMFLAALSSENILDASTEQSRIDNRPWIVRLFNRGLLGNDRTQVVCRFDQRVNLMIDTCQILSHSIYLQDATYTKRLSDEEVKIAQKEVNSLRQLVDVMHEVRVGIAAQSTHYRGEKNIEVSFRMIDSNTDQALKLIVPQLERIEMRLKVVVAEQWPSRTPSSITAAVSTIE